MNTYLTTWNSAYSIGHEKVDQEHKKLFEIASKAYNCENNKTELMLIIKELIKYTKFHFSNEENYMESIGYKNIEEHKNIHKEIVNKLNQLIKKLKTSPIEDNIKELSNFINTNLLQHILIVDKKVHHSMKSREDLKKYFAWKSSYEVKDKKIDNEHKELFKVAIEALNYHDKDIKKHIKTTINKLYEYMKCHFENEEKYMASIEYSDLKNHVAQHKKIINEMNSFIKSIPLLTLVDFERKLIEYIDIWLIGHIIYEDRKIVNENNNK